MSFADPIVGAKEANSKHLESPDRGPSMTGRRYVSPATLLQRGEGSVRIHQ